MPLWKFGLCKITFGLRSNWLEIGHLSQWENTTPWPIWIGLFSNFGECILPVQSWVPWISQRLGRSWQFLLVLRLLRCKKRSMCQSLYWSKFWILFYLYKFQTIFHTSWAASWPQKNQNRRTKWNSRTAGALLQREDVYQMWWLGRYLQSVERQNGLFGSKLKLIIACMVSLGKIFLIQKSCIYCRYRRISGRKHD